MIAGRGVGTRLHSTVLSQFDADVRFFRVTAPVDDATRALCADADLIILATPTTLHGEHLRSLLGAGIATPLLMEKPVCARLGELLQIVAELPRRSADIGVNYELRFNPMVAQLTRHLSATEDWAELELIYHSSAARSNGWLRLDVQSGERMRVLHTIGSHLFDLIHFVINADAALEVAAIDRWTSSQFAATLCCRARPRLTVRVEIDLTRTKGRCTASVSNSQGYRSLLLDFIREKAFRGDTSVTLEHKPDLLRTSTEGLWRKSYRRLLGCFFSSGQFLPPTATLQDAVRVHEVLHTLSA